MFFSLRTFSSKYASNESYAARCSEIWKGKIILELSYLCSLFCVPHFTNTATLNVIYYLTIL